MWFAVVAMLIISAYNAISTARRNAREEKRERDSPTKALEDRVADHDKKLANDKARLDAHERRLDDIQRGLMANCAGTQALLDHALHDGNSNEMSDASKNIDKWLRERP